MATIGSDEEQRAIATMVGNADYGFHWIGFTDEDVEGDFRWVTGEEVIYSKWAAGEPNGGSSENYVALRTADASWVDVSNVRSLPEDDQPIGYIVEFEPLVAKKPSESMELPYNGKEQSAISPGVGYALSGDVSATEVGAYATTAELLEGYTWEDGTTDAVTCAWSITRAKGNSVSVQDFVFTYDGVGHAIETPAASAEGSTILYSLDGTNWIGKNPVFYGVGTWSLYIKATNEHYEDSEVVKVNVTCNPAVLVASYVGETIVEGAAPKGEVTVTGFFEGDENDGLYAYEAPTVEFPSPLKPGTYTLTPKGGVADNYVFQYIAGTLKVTPREDEGTYDRDDGWINLANGGKGYVKNKKLVKGWMDLDGSKYYFQPDGSMSVGWTDVVADGKTYHYYFNPASGNLVRNAWFQIDGRTYYFRPSGNLATGWATISDKGVDKKYYLDEDGQLVTGWRDIDTGNGYAAHYYFRPAGSMATGWATIDGQKYWFRPSGNMATGFTTVDDGYKRYFDGEGHMLVGWQQIDGKTFYFRASGAMQTGEATIDGKTYTFTANGTLTSGTLPAQSVGKEVFVVIQESSEDQSDGSEGLEVLSPDSNEEDASGRAIGGLDDAMTADENIEVM